MVAEHADYIAVILAGGKSSRMGVDKALLAFDGHTLLAHAQQKVAQLISCKMVTSRNKAGYMQDKVPSLGPIGAIYTAMQKFDAKGFLFVAVDTPLLATETMQRLLNFGIKYQQACYFNQSHIPLYLPATDQIKQLVADMVQAKQQLAVGYLIEQIAAVSIPFADVQQLTNTNTPQQWQQFIDAAK